MIANILSSKKQLLQIKKIIIAFLTLICLYMLFSTITADLQYNNITKYQYYGITRLYSNNHKVIGEFSNEHRIYIAYNKIPKIIIDAFISVEDQHYFEHPGVDCPSILRSFLKNLISFLYNRRFVGRSTITQQVVKGFFLSNKRSVIRKIKETILSYRITKIISKQKIIEIYLNQIYFGNYSYGICSASQRYFCKKLEDLSIEEVALLASLPKAPSMLNPYHNHDKMLKRRNISIMRLYEQRYITKEQQFISIHTPINLSYFNTTSLEYQNYYTEAVKYEIIKMFGLRYLSKHGLIINTNIDVLFQQAAQNALNKVLHAYDQTQGWRGPFLRTKKKNMNINGFKKAAKIYHANFKLASVKKIYHSALLLILEDSVELLLTPKYYRRFCHQKTVHWILRKGDVILLSDNNQLIQIPQVNGAVVIVENKSGKILSLVGGYDIKQSTFNRAMQAYRQPGSIFKTFVYLSALEQGIALNTLLLDEPLTINLGRRLPFYNPKNYKNLYLGLITLRRAFERSANLSTMRLLLGVGLDNLKAMAIRYKIYPRNIKATYAMALGAYETTLLQVTNAYASIANGGIMMKPKLIESIYNREGNLVYTSKDIFLEDIRIDYIFPKIAAVGELMVDSATNYQMLSLLQGVVRRGSSKRINIQRKNIAGKTGTTNKSFDAWFIGMTPDFTMGVYIGHDIPKSLGKDISGSNLALPVFTNFLQDIQYLSNRIFIKPETVGEKFISLNNGKVLMDQHPKRYFNIDQVIREVFQKRHRYFQ